MTEHIMKKIRRIYILLRMEDDKRKRMLLEEVLKYYLEDLYVQWIFEKTSKVTI